jgi:hypothetical protein
MFNKIKEFFTGSKSAVETTTQEVPLTAADVAIRNIKETTAAVDAKVEATPKSAPVKEQAWTKNPPATIAKNTKPKQQSTKAVPAPKKRQPAPK